MESKLSKIDEWMKANWGEDYNNRVENVPKQVPTDGVTDISSTPANLNGGNLAQTIADNIKKYEDEKRANYTK